MNISRRFQNAEFLKQERTSYFRALSYKSVKKPNELSNSVVSNFSHFLSKNSPISPITPLHFSVMQQQPINELKMQKPPSNDFIRFLIRVYENKYFDYFLNSLALTSMIINTLDTPIIDPDSEFIHRLNILDIIISTIYLSEFILRIWIYGGKIYFQQSFFNYVDFFNAMVSLFLLINLRDERRVLKVMKSLRAFRLIRALFVFNKDLNIFGDCLVHSFIHVIKLLFFYGLFVLCFSLFAMKNLKGKLFHCVDFDHEIHIETQQDCFDIGGSWINSDTPFDNILIAFFTLFEVSTSEGWSIIMFFNFY